ncbi:uncharacterized protein LOC117607081 [Osmia lignaria lignaria]|uniref:uncharacterized protein LOC117607081 n=1 Tax=Osmia lignaria lignaria TaxID=1437193 RepID=UPI0014790397|nr:uncharacterized protein LOC117607081 [Osmia lignaria]
MEQNSDPGAEISDQSREAGPSGVQIQNVDQNLLHQYPGHNCRGPRCVCQRYENGEVAAAIMNQNRNNNQDDNYQNTGRGLRNFQNRSGGSAQMHSNHNPGYQNPMELIHNYNRNRQQQEPEENIYERLDNDDDDDENDENNREVVRNEPAAQNNHDNVDDHTYERIDDRYSCSGRTYARCYKYHVLNPYTVPPNFLNDIESRNQYDQSRQLYLDSSRLSSQFCQNRLDRLGRNCFSTENIAYASTGRAIYPLGYNFMRLFCKHLDARYLCHHCHNLHNRLRYQDGLSSNSRQYIYQLPRKVPFCRGEYSYVKLPVTSSCRPAESLRMECLCRIPNCSCRCKVLPNCNSTVQINRYLDCVGRGGPSVNNPMYATVHIGRSCVSTLGNTVAGGNSSIGADSGASTSSAPVPTSTVNEPSTSSNARQIFSPNNPSTSQVSACSSNRLMERQHTCDDSCIRNQSGNVAGICQFLGRCDKAECNHSRLSVHWWLVNRWLPPWNPNNFDRNIDSVPSVEESDSDDT